MNGGYLMVSKTDTNLYTKLNNALTLGKPVLWYEDDNTCYYIDTITKSGTDIILTKGDKTITIESDGDITEVGDIQLKMNILDFTDYDLSKDISSADNISEANEITKEKFDEIQAVFKDCQDNFKMLGIKTNAMYDDIDMKGLVIATNIINTMNQYSSVIYYDFADNIIKEITIYTHSGKYYVSVTSGGWYR